MFKTIALIGLAATLAVPPAAALAQHGISEVLRQRRAGASRLHPVVDAVRPRVELQPSVQL